MGHFLKNCVQNVLHTEGGDLAKMSSFLQFQTAFYLKNQAQQLSYCANELPKLVAQVLKFENNELDNTLKIIDLMSVDAILKRGFSITRKNGKVLTNMNEVNEGDLLETHLAEGIITTQVINLTT